MLGLSYNLKFEGKKKGKGSFESYTYIAVSRPQKFLMEPFSKKKDIGIIDKGNLQLQGKGKNYLPYFFYSNFVFSKLKVTNMAHIELPFVLLVFGTHLTSKNVKEFHVVQKNYWD